ncbi:hypothetical protein CRENBAI_001536 [Crenichthys baileyi]|uniref:Uncharacterized protein n=1 Tax=Crenichthys baileyi TaxID=28760 RepID=A0AAV9S8I5_9TELE
MKVVTPRGVTTTGLLEQRSQRNHSRDAVSTSRVNRFSLPERRTNSPHHRGYDNEQLVDGLNEPSCNAQLRS